MTPDDLIREGRQLQRPCVFLRPEPNGPVAGVWFERESGNDRSQKEHCWLAIDTQQIPIASSLTGYLSIYTDEVKCEGGRVAVTKAWPELPGTPLYAHAAVVLPPIDAVFARGSDAVGEWIRSHGWDRGERYNDNFEEREIVGEYERVWMAEHPIYRESDIYAVLGGWHFPCADDDWHDLIDEQFLGFTLLDSEPWVEVWRFRTGELKVIQRVT
jgi:hypothetical protein